MIQIRRRHRSVRLLVLLISVVSISGWAVFRSHSQTASARHADSLREIAFGQANGCEGNTWSTRSSMPTPVIEAAGVVANGQFYVMNGATGASISTQVYNPSTDSWSVRASDPVPQAESSAGAIGNKIYVAEGWLNSDSSSPTNALEIYDPISDSWTSGAPSLIARGESAAAVIDTKLYVAGGDKFGGFVKFSDLEIYDSLANSWSMGAPLPMAIENASGAAIGGKFYVVAGDYGPTNVNNTPSGFLFIYDPVTNSWSTGASMPTPRSSAASAVVDGKLYVVGGNTNNGVNNGGAVSTVEIYDPASNSWTTGPAEPVAHEIQTAGVINSNLYVAGGYNSSGNLDGALYLLSGCAAPAPTPFPITPKGNGKLAYTQGLDDGTIQIFTSDPEGGPATQLTSTGVNVDPAFSPDGTRIAFASNRAGNLEIYVMNADGNQPVRLTNAPRADRAPSWSPDGTKIVFESRRDTGPMAGFQLYVMNADGSGQTRLTNNTTNDGHASWSPDGMHIAFQSNREGNGRNHIYLMNPDGSSQTRVYMTPQTTLEEAQPAWSPDGTRLLFVAGDLGADSPSVVTSKLYSALADGSDTVQLTALPEGAVDTSPTYSPNGTRIAFVTWADANATVGSLVTVGSTGGTFSSPIHDSIEGHAVSWQPVSDVTPPTSTLQVNGTIGNNGWYRSPVSLVLSATDGNGPGDPGTGVRHISYSASGAQEISPIDVSAPSVALLIDAEGETTLTYFATDNAGNVEAAQTITVRIDRTAPVINAPGSILAEAASPAGAVVNYSVTATDNFDPTPVLTCVPPSGTTFSLGTTSVQCSASDASGNNSNASFIVTVVDTTKPFLSLPSDTSVDANSPQGATVSFIATATDAVDPHPVVSCSPLSGSIFSIGVHMVQCTATDTSGNSAQGSFNVTVNGPSAQTAALITLIQSFNLAQGTSNSLEMKLRNVLDALNGTNTGKTGNACKQLVAFINSVQAQSGKELTTAQANQLIASANQVRAANGCQ